MRPRLTLSPPLLAFSAIAALSLLGPARSAKAQFSYGYDSFVNIPPAQAYWNGAGYGGPYTDPTTGVFAAGTQTPYRGLTPYMEPPYGQFGRSNGLNYARTAPVTTAPRAGAALAPAPAQVRTTTPTVRRRGLFGRNRAR